HSFALVSDAVHSLGDALTSGALLGALILSQRPPDRQHPYGHARAETVAGSATALLLIGSAVWVAWEALRTMTQEYQQPETYTLGIAALSFVLKEGLYRYNVRVARRAGSSALWASAWDHRLDALNSLVVLGAVALARWGGPQFHLADHVAALGVAATILWVAGSLLWNSLHELMDRQAEPQLLGPGREGAVGVRGVGGGGERLSRQTRLAY